MKVIYISGHSYTHPCGAYLVIISIVYTQNTEYDAISVFLNTKRELRYTRWRPMRKDSHIL